MDRFQLEMAAGWSSTATAFLATLGGIFAAIKLWSFTRAFLSIFVLPGKSLRNYGPKGSWAVITGASDGLGKEYALQLARAGYNIVLVSRSVSKLEAVAQEITQNNGTIQTKILDMDFAEDYSEDYSRLQKMIEHLDVAILVNNVGRSHAIPVPFLSTDRDELDDIITINCLGTLRITQAVAQGMVERKRGLILTMGSFAGLFPTPLLATYAGSKAFLQAWSTALAGELEPSGVTVQFVQSYLVTSAMSKIRRPTMLIPNARNFVRSVLSHVGRSGGLFSYSYTSVPYWSHGLMAWSIATFLGPMSKIVVKINRSMHESIRKRALRKIEREAGKKAL
ncbi:hypothetical protein FQN57_001941 [Myotisia sp. PD_48]|nr:hypothetical protein FQN57_001941 [Myotisia sp. PD_48]